MSQRCQFHPLHSCYKTYTTSSSVRVVVYTPQLATPTYADEPPLHHYDLYRLQPTASAMARLNLGATLGGAVTLVEWAERLAEAGLLPEERLDVLLMVLAQDSSCGEEEDEDGGDRRVRQLTLVPHGDSWRSRVHALVQQLEGDGLVAVCHPGVQ